MPFYSPSFSFLPSVCSFFFEFVAFMSETREVIVDKDNNMENFDAIDDPLENSTILHTKRF